MSEVKKTTEEKIEICRRYLEKRGYVVTRSLAAARQQEREQMAAHRKNTRPKVKVSGLLYFDSLPDDARAALPVVCALFDISPATVWRRVKSGVLPEPVKDGSSTRWIVGDLRRCLADAR